ncbi:Fe3+ hydroxamate ABC transporter substrate-binding protein [Anaerobacillus alkalidiazotrophicus]|uniref:Fe3+ hydroxamate ABC transporter substrate-binding protein n=1 Tax=Anaerobacillus alkalidiazotrophicus TaxID=472963 RepID=A0A1S2LWZ4_9BACI|nr:Fe3+ hydroxamate ABC transporter substrate-binding protein [Anaerobacillus alkalidiazotrophicus]OIJ16844.1 Fe3+ hydroxamate ABC transporter substrate-binding protein [Anaerobacillus alkalidiazotrophicus]
MFKIKPKCSICDQHIKGNDVVYVKMRYPQFRGMTEIKAYLQNEGKFICEDCYEKK